MKIFRFPKILHTSNPTRREDQNDILIIQLFGRLADTKWRGPKGQQCQLGVLCELTKRSTNRNSNAKDRVLWRMPLPGAWWGLGLGCGFGLFFRKCDPGRHDIHQRGCISTNSGGGISGIFQYCSLGSVHHDRLLLADWLVEIGTCYGKILAETPKFSKVHSISEASNTSEKVIPTAIIRYLFDVLYCM